MLHIQCYMIEQISKRICKYYSGETQSSLRICTYIFYIFVLYDICNIGCSKSLPLTLGLWALNMS